MKNDFAERGVVCVGFHPSKYCGAGHPVWHEWLLAQLVGRLEAEGAAEDGVGRKYRLTVLLVAVQKCTHTNTFEMHTAQQPDSLPSMPTTYIPHPDTRIPHTALPHHHCGNALAWAGIHDQPGGNTLSGGDDFAVVG